MKQFRSWWKVLPVSALALSACNEKKVEEVKKATEEKVATVVEKVTGETPAPVVKGLTPGERAAFLGVIGHISKDSESFFSVLDGKEIVSRLRSLKTWGFIRETAKEQGGEDPEDSLQDGATEASKFLGQEFFIATGKGTATQVTNLVKVNQKSTYLQFRVLANGFAKSAASGKLDEAAITSSLSGGAVWQDAIRDLLKDSALLDSLQFPPLLTGVKAVDKESADLALQQITGGLASLPQFIGEAVTPLDFSKGGVAFKGYTISGAGFAEPLEQSRAEMEQSMDPADVTKVIEAIKKKTIVVAVGSLDNYVMVYIGDSQESLPLTDKIEDSLAAKEDISFVDGYAGKKVVSLFYGDQSLAKSAVAPGLKPIADGVRDGIAGVEGFGDTRDLAAMLDTVGEKEGAILALAKPASVGGLVVLEDGVKFELFGGTDQGAVDYEATHKIGAVTPDDDTLLTGSWVVTDEYNKRSTEAAEALVETAYALTSKVASFDITEPEEFAQFKSGLGLFDTKFRADVVGLFGGLQTTGAGLGKETGFIVDLKGKLPPIPGIPQELVNEGHSIRISSIAPVTDRSKLSDGWTKINGATTNILKTVSEMSGNQIPMPQPTSSEKNGVVTWFFPLPFFNDDLMPSVTVSDKWFVTSTSKLQAQDLVATAEAGKTDRKGAWLELNFKALRKFGSQWVDLVDKYGDKVITNADELTEFRAQLPTIRKGLAAAAEWDKLDFYTRKEGGKIRGTIHFKVN
ncbi:MAG: hypothetical protein JWO82_946 [Akkermansiaceae bacterium]|nr:hypothetical protein [Akkermansiaceae bacterium]